MNPRKIETQRFSGCDVIIRRQGIESRMNKSFRKLAVITVTIAGLIVSDLRSEEIALFDRRPQPWQRLDRPILSARTTTENWCKVVCYSPHVIFHEGKFCMWYLGTSGPTRQGDLAMGYAESDNGFDWTPHPGNPILTGDDLPFANGFQTPFVLFDREESIFKMWFAVVTATDHSRQALGYGTSADGLKWDLYPETLYTSIRRPMVHKTGPAKYRMWANSAAATVGGDLFTAIFEFFSTDGLQWTRKKKAAIEASGRIESCVYPFVIHCQNRYGMWYGGHVKGGMFELFHATSPDGVTWSPDHERSVFAAAPGKSRFDSRYTSTPCIVVRPTRYFLYYSARDWNRDYIDKDGRRRRDNSSPYSHIGVAVLPRSSDH